MIKTAFVAACVLAVSGSVAFAQSRISPTEAPFGADGPAERSVGGDPNVSHTWNGSTSSSSMRNAQMKWESAHGAKSSSGYDPSRY
jgi:hypothetical protein